MIHSYTLTKTLPLLDVICRFRKKRHLPPPIQIEGNLERIISGNGRAWVNCTEDYRDWIKIGFAIASELGENGRDHFHNLPRFLSFLLAYTF